VAKSGAAPSRAEVVGGEIIMHILFVIGLIILALVISPAWVFQGVLIWLGVSVVCSAVFVTFILLKPDER